jgi:hypothetical protein
MVLYSTAYALKTSSSAALAVQVILSRREVMMRLVRVG